MLFIGVVFQSLISFFLASIFNLSVIFFISFFAFVILNIEILSLFKGISGQNILILTFLEFLIVGFIWFKNKKIPSTSNFKGFLIELKNSLLADKSLLVLFLFWVFCITISFILALLSPVNEPDAQGYHALRSLFWAKDGFISHFEIADIRCHSMPINSELFYVWILSLSKNDLGFGLLQFFSYFLLIISSFKIMEFYEIDFNKRIWSILIFSSFAGVISQISSTQTDLLVGSLLTTSFYLILEFKKQNKLNFLYFASLSMAISFGVKSTGIIASIPLLIWYIFILRKEFIKYFLFLILNFSIFSSYNYILNLINYSSPLGSKSALLGHGFWGGFGAIVANFIRYIFQFFDFSGFTIGFYINKFLLSAQAAAIEFFNIPRDLGENVGLNFTNISMTEQVLGFGILGFLVFLPSSIIGFFNKKLRIFSIIFWAMILTLSFSIAYMIYSIRFIVTFIAFSIPLISLTYFKKMNLYKFFIILFAIFYLGYASLFLSQRPMYHLKKEFQKTPDIKLIQNKMRDLNYKFYPSFNEAYTMKSAVEPICKNNSKIAIFASNGYMLYSTKFLEFNNSCKIDTLNILHIRNYDLSNYDYIITQKNLPQHIEVINANDIKNPLTPSNKAICYYEGFDYKRRPRLLNFNELDKALSVSCKINNEFLADIGFKISGEIEAKLPKYLLDRENETVKDFLIWSKK